MSEDTTILEPDEGAVFAYPAAVRASDLDAPGLLALAQKQRAIDPSVFEDSPPFFWLSEITSNRVDSYWTRMQKSSLQNYAAESEAGVPFQQSHDIYELPLGQSLTGKFTGSQGNGLARVEAACFTIPDLQLGSVDSSQFIRGVKAGIVRYVSIGFYGGRFICSICNNDLFDWMLCQHFLGETYDIKNSKGEVVRQEIAIGNVEDAHLAEISAVYKGATPGAEILKARQQMEAGNLNPETARILEQRYRIKLPGARHVWPGKEGERQVSTNEVPTEFKSSIIDKPVDLSLINEEARDTVVQVLTSYEAELTKLRAVKPEAPEATILPTARTIAKDAGMPDDFASVEDGIRSLAAEVTRLRPLADDGTAYKTHLTEVALKEAVRAGFSEETYKGVLARASVEEIRTMITDFGVKGDALFPGGRQTVDTVDDNQPVKRTVPAAAFAV